MKKSFNCSQDKCAALYFHLLNLT